MVLAAVAGDEAAALGEVGERLRHQGEGDVEVDDKDAEDEDGEGEGGGDAGEDGERDGGDEEEGHDAGVEGIEERHLRERLNTNSELDGRKVMGHDMAEIVVVVGCFFFFLSSFDVDCRW